MDITKHAYLPHTMIRVFKSLIDYHADSGFFVIFLNIICRIHADVLGVSATGNRFTYTRLKVKKKTYTT